MRAAIIRAASFLLILTVVITGSIDVDAKGGGRKWAVVVGINEYMKEVTPLRCAINDADKFRKALIEKAGFAENDVYLLTSGSKGNRIPDKSNIIRWISYVKQNACADDTFVFFFSGHGMDMANESYLLTYEADPYSKDTLDVSSLKVNDLRRIVEEMPLGKILLFVDACRNDPRSGKGEVDNRMTDGQAKNLVIASGYKEDVKTGGNFSLTVFSCKVGQRSYEWTEQGMGFFTCYLVKGLKGEKGAVDQGGNVTLGSLKSYLANEVPSAVQRERGAGMSQDPMIKGDESADADQWIMVKLGGGGTVAKQEPDKPKVTSTLPPDREKAEQRYTAGDDHYYTMKGYLDLGYIDQAKTEYEKALDSYTEAISLYPQFAEAYASRGIVYGEAQEYDKALQDCEKAVELNPSSAMAYNNRSIVHFWRGDVDKTIQDCSKAIELDPELPNSLNMRGYTFLKKGEYDRAIADFTNVLKIDQKNFYAFDFRGRVYAKKGQLDMAISDFSKAVEYRPKYAPAYFNRAVAYLQTGANDKALQDCNKAIEISPREAPVYQVKAVICQKLGKKAEAEEAQRKFEELSSKKSSAPDKAKSNEGTEQNPDTQKTNDKLKELEEKLKRMEGQ